MKREDLLYKLTGTETPKFITKRENMIIDKCLDIINDLEEKAKNNSSNTSHVINDKKNDEFSFHQNWKDETKSDDDGHGGSIKHFQS